VFRAAVHPPSSSSCDYHLLHRAAVRILVQFGSCRPRFTPSSPSSIDLSRIGSCNPTVPTFRTSVAVPHAALHLIPLAPTLSASPAPRSTSAPRFPPCASLMSLATPSPRVPFPDPTCPVSSAVSSIRPLGPLPLLSYHVHISPWVNTSKLAPTVLMGQNCPEMVMPLHLMYILLACN